VIEWVLKFHKKNELTSSIDEIQVKMATKSMGEKLHMKMDEGGSILQHQALPKA